MAKYYPTLNTLIDASAIPGDFQALQDLAQDGIDLLLGKILYKDLVTRISPDGTTRYYSLTLIVKELKLPVLGTGMNLVLFSDPGGAYSSFPLVLDWRWELYKYISRLETEGFSYLPEAFLDIFLELADIGDVNTFIAEIIRVFLDGGDNGYLSALDGLINLVSGYNNGDPAVTTLLTNITTQLTAIKTRVESLLTTSNFFTIGSILANYDSDATLGPAVTSIESSIDTLETDHNIQVNVLGDMLLAVLGNLGDIEEKFEKLADLFKGWLQGITKEDFYNLLVPSFSVELNSISAGLEFPRTWLKPTIESPPSSGNFIEDPDQTQLATLEFEIGKLKLSTQSGFEFENQMNFSFKRALIGNTGIMLAFSGLKVDVSKSYNIPEADADGRPSDFQGLYAESASVTLPADWFKDPDGTNAEIFGEKLLIGTGGLSGKIGLRGIGGDNMFKAKLGSTNGFELGFKKFDLVFKQNKVKSSDIQLQLGIPNFVYPGGHPQAGDPVKLDLAGHIGDDGDFNLTASTEPPFPIEWDGVFTYHIRSLELGRQDDDFYLGTSGKIEFQGFLRDTLKLGAIDIEKLRIYSDGNIEFEGGSINLIEPIVLPLGPVEITVSAIHYGSHQREIDNEVRKFNYFGFDGGISVDPLGIEVRGDGVKFYYCVDDKPNRPAPYLHIQTLHLDLTIPASSPAVIINGWLSIPEPGASKEYAGGVKIQIPQAKIAGHADMKLMPKYPAFIIDAGIDLPAPIPLGPVGIYGFRGLIGYRYVAEKEAVGLSSQDSWYDYYKFPPRGIHVSKFSGPDRSVTSGTPFSIGAGASLGTSFDNGTVLNIKAMVLLSIPSLFMIDGRASVLSARLGLEDPKEPPFFAFIAIGDNSLELGFGADFKMPTKSGDILSLYADVQAGFFFNDASRWYVNFGTRENPVKAQVIRILKITAFLMLSAKGIEAGARGELSFRRKYGPIKVAAWAYIEVGGKISFERPQFGAFMAAGVGADIDIKIVSLYASFDMLLGVEAAKPFKIFGEFRVCVRISILWVFKFRFCGNLSLLWEFNSEVDTTPVNPLLASSPANTLPGFVQGVNMLSNETFDLVHLGGNIPGNLPANVRNNIIPIDTYIDLRTTKGLQPNAVSSTIAALGPTSTDHVELIPPEKMIRGKEVRQVKHSYSVESVEIKSWNPSSNSWVDYHPWKALYPTDPALNNKFFGQFQFTDGRYNVLRLLATNPLSYTEQGLQEWGVPEQNGLTPGVIFCEDERLTRHCENFLNKPIGQRYYCPTVNDLFYTLKIAYLLLDHGEGEYADISAEANPHQFPLSLRFQNQHKLQIRLPKPSVEVSLRLTTYSQSVKIYYYATLRDYSSLFLQYGHPDPSSATPLGAHVVTVNAADLINPVEYIKPDWNPVTRIVVVPDHPDQTAIQALEIRIAETQAENRLITYKIEEGNLKPVKPIIDQLKEIKGKGCSEDRSNPDPNERMCKLYQELLSFLDCLRVFNDNTFNDFMGCLDGYLRTVEQFYNQNPNEPFPREKEYLLDWMRNWQKDPKLETGGSIFPWASEFAETIGILGGCIPAPDKCYTLLHEVCYLSLEEHQYNVSIQSQAAISATNDNIVDGITGYIQPVWRPDTSYAVRFVLKDTVDDGANPAGTFAYSFGFSTAGPLGYFHEHPQANYGDPQQPDQFPLTSLTRYLDFERSYPNADGNILNAKPLFYDDETTAIHLFFAKPWARHFFHEWPSYNGNAARKGRLKIVIKDPKEGSTITNPPYLDYDPTDTVHTNIPQTVENWQTDPNPQIPFPLRQYQALLESQNCVLWGGNVIKPASQSMQVFPKHLKPQKLYTALVNNLYDVDADGTLEEASESRQVHRFTFQTSRYKSFAEQVNSYLLTYDEGPSIEQRPAVFSISVALTNVEIQAGLDCIIGNSNPGMERDYVHRFDRIWEGLWGMSPLPPAKGTEFNLIRNSNDNDTIVAILIRNPEPFNNPRMPVSEVEDTLQVMSGGSPNGTYRYLHSKDYSQVIVMRTNLQISGTLDFRFRYKLWDGNQYAVPGTPEYSTDEIGTILVSGLNLNNF